MKIGIPFEHDAHETRVALVPDAVGRLVLLTEITQV